MRLLTIAIMALALGAGTARTDDCTLKQYGSVPMEVYPDHLLLPVTFGATPGKLVFRMDDAARRLHRADETNAGAIRASDPERYSLWHRRE
jgi:hypothetical protein